MQSKEEELVKRKEALRNRLAQLRKERKDLRAAIEVNAGMRGRRRLGRLLGLSADLPRDRSHDGGGGGQRGRRGEATAAPQPAPLLSGRVAPGAVPTFGCCRQGWSTGRAPGTKRFRVLCMTKPLWLWAGEQCTGTGTMQGPR